MNKKRLYSLLALSILGSLASFYGIKLYQEHEDKKLKILFVGNSMTQDAVSYVPMILKNIAPELKFKIYDWYCGGYTAREHIQDWQNNKTAQTLSIADNSFKWKNYYSPDFFTEKVGNAVKSIRSKLKSKITLGTEKEESKDDKKNNQVVSVPSVGSRWDNHYISGILMSDMADILKNEKFDIIVVQEYFNRSKGSYTKEDFDGFKNMLGYIKEHAPYPFYSAFLLHPPRRDETNSTHFLSMNRIYNLSQKSTKKILKETDIEGFIPVGIAMYDACSTDLNKLGDKGGLSVDYIHAQEGLPCMLMAYVTTQWILDKLKTNKTILGDKTRVTSKNYPTIKVPGANFGSGVVEGTEEQYKQVQRLALEAIQKGKALEKSVQQNENLLMSVKERVLNR